MGDVYTDERLGEIDDAITKLRALIAAQHYTCAFVYVYDSVAQAEQMRGQKHPMPNFSMPGHGIDVGDMLVGEQGIVKSVIDTDGSKVPVWVSSEELLGMPNERYHEIVATILAYVDAHSV